MILAEIHRLTRFAKQYEDEFAKLVMGFSLKSSQVERERKQKAVYAKNARIREIDKLIERLYEDNVYGRVNDERFSRMTANYEIEQGSLMEEVRDLNEALSLEESSAMSTADFIKIVRKYTRVKKLTPIMLHELIDHIEVYSAEKLDGKKTQKLVTYYNCVGNLQIPELKNLQAPEIELQTRKGVAVSYSTD